MNAREELEARYARLSREQRRLYDRIARQYASRNLSMRDYFLRYNPMSWFWIVGIAEDEPVPATPEGYLTRPWFDRLYTQTSHDTRPDANTLASELLTLSTYLRASRLCDPNVFAFSHSLTERLLETDASGVRGSDLRLPFDGLYLEFPYNAVLKSSFLSVGLGASLGPANPDIRALEVSYLTEDATGVAAGFMRLPLGSWPIGEIPTRSFDSISSAADARTDADALTNLVVNALLYLSSHNPDVSPRREKQGLWTAFKAQPRRTKISVRRRKGKRRQFTLGCRGFHNNDWDVGKNVKKLRMQPTDVVVRGHFRNQAHGPRHSLRKIIWIEPHVRLPTAPGRSPGHEYVAGDD